MQVPLRAGPYFKPLLASRSVTQDSSSANCSINVNNFCPDLGGFSRKMLLCTWRPHRSGAIGTIQGAPLSPLIHLISRLQFAMSGQCLALRLVEATRAGDLEAVSAILRGRAVRSLSSQVRCDYLAPGFLEAAAEGRVAIVRALMHAGACVDHPYPPSGDTALGIAAFAGRDEIVTTLVGAGADPNVRNEMGVTPLMLAAGGCSASTLAFLLQAGADLWARAAGGLSVFTFAEVEGRLENLELLRRVRLRHFAMRCKLHLRSCRVHGVAESG